MSERKSITKEFDESIYWLKLLKETKYLIEREFKIIHIEAIGLLEILKSAIITSKTTFVTHCS